MPKGVVRGVGALLVLIGLTMFLNVVLSWNFGQPVFNALRALHLLLGLAFVGLYEMMMARRKGIMTVAGRQLGLATRILLTLVLLVGFYLLLSHAIDALGGYDGLIWVHGLAGLVAYGLTEMVLSPRRTIAQ
jgi:hypothetical protein